MEEIWKDIVGYEGYYQVSNLGNFRSLNRIIKYKNNGLRKYPGKSLSVEPTKDGYRRIVLMKDGIKKRYMAHRIVAETFIPNPDNKPCINHIDGCKHNNNVENLEWCTPSENVLHAIRIGLQIPQNNIPSNSKSVQCIDTGEVFPTCRKAAQWQGVNTTSLARATKNNRPCKGVHWKYI